ncbi:MAG: protein kinase [Phycisphaerales bacterium]|nr:MAG: protein kinase [Phycisphaerales bacterium]
MKEKTTFGAQPECLKRLLLLGQDEPGEEKESPISWDVVAEKPGTQIGRYRLVSVLGEGGMGIVYLAEQTHLVKRQVALKIIKLGMDTRQVVARFAAERQVLAMMDHPNIAKIFDGGTTDTGRPYFVLELARGVAITDYCDRHGLSIRGRLSLFLQVCKAVEHAHAKGIVHRDIKPSNIMVTTRDGSPVPKVIDFGIAKATHQRLTDRTLFTRYAQIVGTPDYMSPEQAEFGDTPIDARTDVYSLGVLLYELLTGTTPFRVTEDRGRPYDVICRTIRETEPPKPSTRLGALGETAVKLAEQRGVTFDQLHRTIRGDLDWIVMKALEKDRACRYQSVGELASEIGRHLSNQRIMAGPPSTVYRISKLVRRHRLAVAFAALATAALALGATTAGMLGLPFGHGQAEHASGMVQRHIWNSVSMSSLGHGISQDGRYLPYIDWTAGNLAIRDLETETDWLLTNHTDTTWKTIEGWAESAVMSPDGSRVAYSWVLNDGLDSYQLRVAEPDGSKVGTLYHDAATFWIGPLAWSPDGADILMYHSDREGTELDDSGQRSVRVGHWTLVSARDGSVRPLKTWRRRATPWTTAAAFSPDGRFVAYDVNVEGDPVNRDIVVLDLETGLETPLVEHPAEDRFAAWTPDGQRIVFTSDRGTRTGLWMLGVSAGSPTDPPRRLLGDFNGKPIGFDTDGSLFYTLRATTTDVYLAYLSVAGNQLENQPRLASSRYVGSATMADWSPDGQWLAYRCGLSAHYDNTLGRGDWAVVLYSVETGRERVVSALPEFVGGTRMTGPRWSPSGDTVLVGATSSETGHGLYTIDIDTGRVTLVKRVPEGRIFEACWSPDGESITYAVARKGILRFELETGETKTLFKRSHTFDLSPDGQWLAFWQEGEAVTVMPSKGGSPREIVRPNRPRSSTGIRFVTWTPDGKYLLYPHGDQLRKIHVETGRHWQIGQTMPHLIDVAIHPDGMPMALTLEQEGSELWIMENFLPE